MMSELALIKEIKKYPSLYNFSLPDYTRKEVTRLAWAAVSKKLKSPVLDCKEKWRNIRSSLLRSLKPSASGSRQKKPYYLKKHLHFILPFIRPMKNTPVNNPGVSVSPRLETGEVWSELDDPLDDSESDSVDVKTNVFSTVPSPQDDSRSEQNETSTFDELSVPETAVPAPQGNVTPPSTQGNITSSSTQENMTSPSTQGRRSTTQSRIAKANRRRNGLLNTSKTLEQTLKAYFNAKVRRIEAAPSPAPTIVRTSQPTSFSSSTGDTGENSLRLFMMSLLPDLETMSADQIRTFKIKVMLLIDSMKSGQRNTRTASCNQSVHLPESSSVPSSSVGTLPEPRIKQEFPHSLNDEESSIS